MDDGMHDRFAAVLAEAETEQAANAMAVATAVYASVTLADRFRAAQGMSVAVVTRAAALAVQAGQEPVGRVVDVAADAVVIESGAARWVVPLGAIETVRGLPAGHRPAGSSALGRLGLGHLLRPLCGEQVLIASGTSRYAGSLQRIGSDHLELGGTRGSTVVAMSCVAWIRLARPPRAGDY
jgi:hypothetical protein